MKIGNYRRIFKQDYSTENQDDIDTLSITLNESFEAIYNAMDHQLTLSDNINCTLKTFTASVDSNSRPIVPITIKLDSWQKNINGVVVLNAVAIDKRNYPNSGLFIDFSINNNVTSSSNSTNTGNSNNSPFTININYIKGLPANVPFNITILII